jgi:uncharacterized membrane protein
MDWPVVVVQWLHVLLGITWFGASIATNFIFVPAITRFPLADQQRVGSAYGQVSVRLIRPVAALVILLGILRGTVFGNIRSADFLFGSAYGWTWIVGLVAAIATFAWAERMIIPNLERLYALDPAAAFGPDGGPSGEFAATIDRAKRVALVEMVGFVVVFTCMILMRFGA